MTLFLYIDQKTRLKKQLPVFIIKVTLIAERVISLEFMQTMLKLLAQLTVDEVNVDMILEKHISLQSFISLIVYLVLMFL